jgi:PGF-CTERM protein
MERSFVRAVALATLLVLAVPAALGPAAAQEQATVTLTVVDRADERVGGVDLRVVWNNGEGSENVTTRVNGQVLVDVPSGADVEVRVTDDEYLRNRPAAFFGVTGGELEVPVSLPGTARVTVSDASGPIEGADVRLSGNGVTRTVETGADGVAVLGPVERGSYGVRVSQPGYLSNSTGVVLDGTVNRSVTLSEADRQLSVRVVDDHFEEPEALAEATVDIQGVATLTTGSNGQRGTTVAVNSDYRLTVTKQGYEAVTRTVSVGESDESVTVAIQREDAVSIETTSDRVVVGEVTRLTVTDEYGQSVGGAAVSVEGSQVGETDDRGVYDLAVETAGNQTVTVSTDGLSASVVVEGVEPGSQATQSPTETAAPTETATATPTPDPTTTGGGGPGFGALAGLVALLALAAFAVLRR